MKLCNIPLLYRGRQWSCRLFRFVIWFPLSLCLSAVSQTSASNQDGSSFLTSPEVKEALRRTLPLTSRGEYRAAKDIYESLLAQNSRSLDITSRAWVLREIADANVQLGNYSAAERAASESVRTLTEGKKTASAIFPIAEGTLGESLRAQGKYSAARNRLEHAVLAARKSLGASHPAFGILILRLAQLRVDERDFRSAGRLSRQAVGIFEELGDSGRISLGVAWQNLAVAHLYQGKPEYALNAVHLAKAAWNGLLPADHPFLVFALNSELEACTRLKRFATAKEIAARLEEVSLSRFGSTHVQRAFVLGTIASLYIAEGRHREAEPMLRESVSIAKASFSAGHPLLNQLLRNYSGVLTKLGCTEQALAIQAESRLIMWTAASR